mmetsp:Transcript_59598/g.132708  ORF Transcript_59598/g.132708 Transcript_59598/m.132708 type:complete len:248 (+) Transcript_59598:164-907(+)
MPRLHHTQSAERTAASSWRPWIQRVRLHTTISLMMQGSRGGASPARLAGPIAAPSMLGSSAASLGSRVQFSDVYARRRTAISTQRSRRSVMHRLSGIRNVLVRTSKDRGVSRTPCLIGCATECLGPVARVRIRQGAESSVQCVAICYVKRRAACWGLRLTGTLPRWGGRGPGCSGVRRRTMRRTVGVRVAHKKASRLYATRLCQHRIFIDTYTQETFYVTQLERRHTLSRCRNVSGGARCLTRVRWH